MLHVFQVKQFPRKLANLFFKRHKNTPPNLFNADTENSYQDLRRRKELESYDQLIHIILNERTLSTTHD